MSVTYMALWLHQKSIYLLVCLSLVDSCTYKKSWRYTLQVKGSPSWRRFIQSHIPLIVCAKQLVNILQRWNDTVSHVHTGSHTLFCAYKTQRQHFIVYRLQPLMGVTHQVYCYTPSPWISLFSLMTAASGGLLPTDSVASMVSLIPQYRATHNHLPTL